MSLVTAESATIGYGPKLCVKDARFVVGDQARIGLIGANGTGKTTLLRAIRGELDHDGRIHRRKNLSIVSLEQNPELPEGLCVREAVLEAVGSVGQLEREIASIHESLARPGIDPGESERLLSKLSERERRFQQLGGYDVDRRLDMVLDGLGLPKSTHGQNVNTLSGGERSRLALARLLLSEPDLWLLDEPTNHLDLDGLTFLEEFLSRASSAAIIVSHDRYLLDHVTTETWEIEGERLWIYPAPYSESRRLRVERLKSAWREYDEQREEVAKQEEYIRRYGAGQRAKEAKGRAKRLARVQLLDRPADRQRAMAFALPAGKRLGDRVLSAVGLAAEAGEKKLFDCLEFELDPGEALGIVGPNGAGKTTLLRVLLGEHRKIAGDITWGGTVQRAVLTQHEVFENLEATPLDFLMGSGAGLMRSALLDLLGAMLFGGASVDKPVKHLSGGERKRLLLARMMLEGRNVLLLDEPTNHLDTQSREVLEDALAGYDGSLLVVSHDRYFLDLLVDRVLWIEEGAWHLTRGGYTEAAAARAKRLAEALARKAVKAKKPRPAPASRAPSKKSPLARLSTEDLEEKIITLEEKRTALQFDLARPEVYRDAERTREIRAEIEQLERELAALEAEYEMRDS